MPVRILRRAVRQSESTTPQRVRPESELSECLSQVFRSGAFLLVTISEMAPDEEQWQVDLLDGLDGTRNSLVEIQRHRATSDRERSFLTRVSSLLSRCSDGLSMVEGGLHRGREDMILHGAHTLDEAMTDLRTCAEMLRR